MKLKQRKNRKALDKLLTKTTAICLTASFIIHNTSNLSCSTASIPTQGDQDMAR